MAVIRRYFDSSAAGSGNGTSYANRAPLISGGVWSSIITAFNFSADSLECLIQGTHTTPLLTFSSTAPNSLGRLSFRSMVAGDPWVPPDPNWNCCQPVWDTSDMSTLNMSVTVVSNSIFVDFFGLNLFQNFGGAPIQNPSKTWCHCKNTGSGNAYADYLGDSINCFIQSDSGNYSAGTYHPGSRLFDNCRIQGTIGATFGNRHGVWLASTNARLHRCCVIGNLVGVGNVSAGDNSHAVSQCTLVGNATAILDRGSTAQGGQVVNNLIHGSTTGLLVSDNANSKPMYGNVFNSVTTVQTGNDKWDNAGLNAVSSIAPEDLFVDFANGDYRIKQGSPYWGKGIGAGDEPDLSQDYHCFQS